MAEKSLYVELISPENRLYDGEAAWVKLPGIEGSFAVLVGHAPLLSLLGPGEVTIKTHQEEKRFVIEGGFVEVSQDRLTILVEGAFLPQDIDKDKVQQELRSLYESVVSGENALQAREKKAAILRAQLRSASFLVG
ncbi:MAG: ATP synthase F1 subunit epsilon [Leptospiraceae bacterium]|nr:ATP synthase F1 subunit epsilon [Leptospiraceae bacterium]MDW8306024.1 ATP synthase F1 subunit epsilon [Leptospiraceae bacterium]